MYQQMFQTQRAWATLILKRKVDEVNRAHVTLRKQVGGRDPTAEELSKFIANPSNSRRKPDIEDVIDAYSNSDQLVGNPSCEL